jgi:gamma-glutamylcyclotransferase (GGCT)/AIG2-like uncharacterized protein YtfP
MFGLDCIRLIFIMASNAIGKQRANARPTVFYFAYGSNLHLKQMKRRCPNSKYIGRARLGDYRWQINERGYANVVEAEGRWVDGLVYEIDSIDEAKLDINEGVSKNAYTKKYMNVHLQRAPGILYRRPTSWIVNRGGPDKICRQAREEGRPISESSEHWLQEVLVYISLNYTVDSSPKAEYINRINFGLSDARALGMEDDYISNCIRPFIPEAAKKTTATLSAPGAASGSGGGGQAEAGKNSRGLKRNASPRTGERSPARKGQAPAGWSDNQTPQQPPRNRPRSSSAPKRPMASNPGPAPPPLPPRPVNRYRDIPVIVIEEFHWSSYSR